MEEDFFESFGNIQLNKPKKTIIKCFKRRCFSLSYSESNINEKVMKIVSENKIIEQEKGFKSKLFANFLWNNIQNHSDNHDFINLSPKDVKEDYYTPEYHDKTIWSFSKIDENFRLVVENEVDTEDDVIYDLIYFMKDTDVMIYTSDVSTSNFHFKPGDVLLKTRQIEIEMKQEENVLQTKIHFRKAKRFFIENLFSIVYEPKNSGSGEFLSDDCWNEIFSFLTHQELFCFSRINKEMNNKIVNSSIWEYNYSRKFKNCDEFIFEKNDKTTTWYSKFKTKLFQKLKYQTIVLDISKSNSIFGFVDKIPLVDSLKFAMVEVPDDGYQYYSLMHEEYRYGSEVDYYERYNAAVAKNIIGDGKFEINIRPFIDNLYMCFNGRYLKNETEMRFKDSNFTIYPVTSVYPVVIVESFEMSILQKSDLKNAFLKNYTPSVVFIPQSKAILANSFKSNGIVIFISPKNYFKIFIHLENDINKMEEMKYSNKIDLKQKIDDFFKKNEQYAKYEIFISCDEEMKTIFNNQKIRFEKVNDAWNGASTLSKTSNFILNHPNEFYDFFNVAKSSKGLLELNECSSEIAFLHLNQFNKEGRLPIHVAAYYGNIQFIHDVHFFGGDLFLKEKKYGQNILHIACGSGRLELVKYLIEQLKFDVNQKENDGYDCFRIAKTKEIKEYLSKKK
eukprot:gene7796-12270_t